MQKIKFRHLQFIYCLQIIGLIILSSSILQAQKFGSNQNYLEFKNKPYYFGITLAFNASDYKLLSVGKETQITKLNADANEAKDE